MERVSVTFETKCYENDWKILLEKGRLERMIDRCNYKFDRRTLCINNVDDIRSVRDAADKLVSRNILTDYIDVNELSNKVLESFGLEKEAFRGGYYYSIAELAGILFCRTDFLLHFSSDSILEKSEYNWIDSAIDLLRSSPEILVSNPSWNRRCREARKESFREDDKWFYGYGFSDQCYLIEASRFRDKIYNEYNCASERYLKYGGDLFEKRVDSFMRNRELIRITSKKISYIHKNYPKNRLIRKLIFLLWK